MTEEIKNEKHEKDLKEGKEQFMGCLTFMIILYLVKKAIEYIF